MKRLLFIALLALAVAGAHAGGLQCDQCRLPIAGQYTVFDGRNLHDACYERHYAQYCSICALEIQGEYVYNSWGDRVCSIHVGEFPFCEFCDRLKAPRLTGEGRRYDDGREICGVCYPTAVTGQRQAELLLDTVRVLLRGYGIVVEQEFELRLIDRLQMARITPATGREAWGFTELEQRTSLLGFSRTQRIDMHVLSGMPRDVLMRVLAHELMHVWLFVHAPLDMDPVLVEGSCEYAAFLALQHRDSELAQYYQQSQAQNEDLLYGGGFRSVAGYVERVGVSSWLSYLTENEQPPW